MEWDTIDQIIYPLQFLFIFEFVFSEMYCKHSSFWFFPPQFKIRELIWLVYLVCQLSVNSPDWVFKVVNGRAEVLLHPSRNIPFLEQQIFLFLRQSTNKFVLKKFLRIISAFFSSVIICFWHRILHWYHNQLQQ